MTSRIAVAFGTCLKIPGTFDLSVRSTQECSYCLGVIALVHTDAIDMEAWARAATGALVEILQG